MTVMFALQCDFCSDNGCMDSRSSTTVEDLGLANGWERRLSAIPGEVFHRCPTCIEKGNHKLFFSTDSLAG